MPRSSSISSKRIVPLPTSLPMGSSCKGRGARSDDKSTRGDSRARPKRCEQRSCSTRSSTCSTCTRKPARRPHRCRPRRARRPCPRRRAFAHRRRSSAQLQEQRAGLVHVAPPRSPSHSRCEGEASKERISNDRGEHIQSFTHGLRRQSFFIRHRGHRTGVHTDANSTPPEGPRHGRRGGGGGGGGGPLGGLRRVSERL